MAIFKKRIILFLGAIFVANSVFASSPIDKLNLRIHQQFIQINRDIQAGKVTAAQAKSLKVQVEAIRKEELADVKALSTSSGQASDSKTLTDDQLVTLNGELDTLSKQIPIP